MNRNHSMEVGVDRDREDILALYEATGYTRWDEAYGINDDDDQIHPDEAMSTGSDTNTSSISGSSGRESCSNSTGDSDDSSRQLLIDNAEGSNDDSSNQCNDHDDESEDEINHEPISAKEVIEHNKLFGYKTADYWWVHDDKVYSNYFVAYLRPMTHEEIRESTKEEVRDLKRELANTPSLSGTLEEFEKVLCRFEVKLDRPLSIPSGDPNLLPFPTPHDFVQTDLRKWLCSWKPFLFEIELEPPCEPIYPSDPSEISRHKLRPWLDNWEPFDTSIKGESAWKCIQPNLFADDILTKAQREIVEKRARRRQLDNEERMAQRREQLMNYFKTTYHKSVSDLDKYSGFISSLEENCKRLLSLC